MGTNKDNPSWLKIYLSNAIKDAITEYYKVYNEKDFSRNRKLPFQKMVELLLLCLHHIILSLNHWFSQCQGI